MSSFTRQPHGQEASQAANIGVADASRSRWASASWRQRGFGAASLFRELKVEKRRQMSLDSPKVGKLSGHRRPAKLICSAKYKRPCQPAATAGGCQ